MYYISGVIKTSYLQTNLGSTKMNKELNFAIRTATHDAVMGLNDLQVVEQIKPHAINKDGFERARGRKSFSKRDNRAHAYTFIKKLIRGGIEYIQFKTPDGIGYCPLANIESIKNQFDESLTLATN
jgi:hypothetical protein